MKGSRVCPTALSVGHVTHDRYPSRVLAGGSAAYGARVFHALGARSRLVTVVGEDFACDPELCGVEVARGTAPRTTTFENQYPDGGPRRQWVDALAPPVTPALLPAAWARPEVLFLAPVCGEVDVAAWLDAVRAPLVGLGLQGAIKEVCLAHGTERGTVKARPLGLGRDVLCRLDVVFASDEDLRLFARDDLLTTLCATVPVVVVTAGARGATVHHGGQSAHVDAHPAVVVDPTGAGDTFAAAFLFAVARGDGAIDAARFASAAASTVVEGEGGTAIGRLGEADGRTEHVSLGARREQDPRAP